MINNYKCNYGASFEDAIHYFLECPLYLNERRTLLSDCNDINMNRIYNYLSNQCLSPLKLCVRTVFMARCARYNIM